jgi:hypothetical protein
VTTINLIKITKAVEMIEVTKVTVSKLERTDTAKGTSPMGQMPLQRERATNTMSL